MPVIDQQAIREYAFYVAGTVLTGGDWGYVNYGKSLALGILAYLFPLYKLNLVEILHSDAQDEWLTFATRAPELAEVWEQLNTFMFDRPYSDSDLAAISELLKTQAGHEAQKKSYRDFVFPLAWDTARQWLIDDSRAIAFVIFLYSVEPETAYDVVETAGSGADLEKLYTVSQNFTGFKFDFVTKARDMLADWDGQSAPPDDWTNDTGEVSTPGENTYPNGTATGVLESNITYLLQRGDTLSIFGPNYPTGLLCVRTGTYTYKPARNADGTYIYGAAGGASQGTWPGSASAAAAAAVDWMMEHLGQWQYVYGGDRYDPNVTGGTDCSGMVHAAFWQACGVDIGGTTGAIYASAATQLCWTGSSWDSIPWSQMEKGDIILMSKDSPDFSSGTGSHVAIYTGEPGCIVHAGGGSVPQHTCSYSYSGSYFAVKRLVS